MPAEGPSERYWDRQDLTRRLRRIEGQARGVQALVARGASCQAIQTQVAAMQGALDSVRRVVEACRVAEAINEGAGPFDADAIRRALRQGIGS
jgi:DNA-binding FrmR family transcriptional regulator